MIACPAKRAIEALAREEAAYAAEVIAVWNQRQADRRALWFYPTIGAALAAKFPWLSYVCPACETVSQIDLRTVDRHPEASVSSVIHTLKCGRCPGARFPTLVGLGASKP